MAEEAEAVFTSAAEDFLVGNVGSQEEAVVGFPSKLLQLSSNHSANITLRCKGLVAFPGVSFALIMDTRPMVYPGEHDDHNRFMSILDVDLHQIGDFVIVQVHVANQMLTNR